MEDVGKEDEEVVRKVSLMGACDSCLGRLFIQLWPGITNSERGHRLREHFSLPGSNDCSICEGISFRVGFYASLAVKKLQEIEYTTFLVGTKVDPEIIAREEALWSSVNRTGEPLKRELNREIGKAITSLTGKDADFDEPDVTVIVDTRYDFVQIEVHSIFIFGRYRKLIRGIPQTRWVCKRCKGRGCAHCNGKGKMYPESVEEVIGRPFAEASSARDYRLHGMGREDIDVRMLGNGRPFILELLEPKKRVIDLAGAVNCVNTLAGGKVEISGVRYAKRGDVERIKSARYDKSYLVEVRCEGGVEGIEEAIKTLSGAEIEQRTPKRVLQRRADLVRRRRVVEARLISSEKDKAFIMFRVNAGTYVKELITGDENRTTPSLASLLARKCDVIALDVVQVHDEEQR